MRGSLTADCGRLIFAVSPAYATPAKYAIASVFSPLFSAQKLSIKQRR